MIQKQLFLLLLGLLLGMCENQSIFIKGYSTQLEDVLHGSLAARNIALFLGSVYDLRNLCLTSKVYHDLFMKVSYYKEIILQNVRNIATEYGFESLDSFNRFLQSNNLVVSGSCALSFLGDAPGVKPWKCNDMDLFVKTNKNFSRRYLTVEPRFVIVIPGYEQVGMSKEYYLFSGRKRGECHDFLKKDGSRIYKIQIISSSKNFFEQMTGFDFDFLMNFYDPEYGGRFVSINPSKVMRRETVITSNCVREFVEIWKHDVRMLIYSSLDRVMNSISKRQKRFEKYVSRGFVIEGGAPMELFLREILKLSFRNEEDIQNIRKIILNVEDLQNIRKLI